jgi:hypothetical protein
LEAYYAALARVDPEVVEEAVNRAAPRSTDRLAPLIPRFLESQFLFDYLDDRRLVDRLNNVLSRVRLPPLPDSFQNLLPDARRRVTERKTELLTPPAPAGASGSAPAEE